jgi:hypothetical protein
LHIASWALNPNRCLADKMEERAELLGSSKETTREEEEWGM